MNAEILSWMLIAVLLVQSGTFSGLNLAMFGISALRLKVLSDSGNEQAIALMEMRNDSNFLLTTILWGNVATNVLLTQVSDSVMAGGATFIFSTFVITFGGEIIPQAYFSRHALKAASLMAPLLRFYQFLLYPLAKPSAWMLDAWLGKESIDFVSEEELRTTVMAHAKQGTSEISAIEGVGAVNFMDMDDLLLTEEGSPIDPDSIIFLPFENGKPCFPACSVDKEDQFLTQVMTSGAGWILLAPEGQSPCLAMDASAYLRATLSRDGATDPLEFCHEPILVHDESTRLVQVLGQFEHGDRYEILVRHVVVLWANEKRIITGADILGYLMRGIARRRVLVT